MVPRTENGSMNTEVAFRAAVCATIMLVPNVLMLVCSVNVPRLTKEVMNDMEMPVVSSLRYTSFSRFQSSFAKTKRGYFRRM